MLHELNPREFKRVLSLFQPFDYSLSILAAIEGNNPGRIFVDDMHRPSAAFALTVEGYLLTGDPENQEFGRAFSHFLKSKIFTGEIYVNGDWSMSLAVHPETWAAKLPELIPIHEVEKIERYHYLCNAVKLDWRDHIPEGYTVQRVNSTMLHDDRVVFSDLLREWMDIEAYWWNQSNFLSKGVSYVVLCDWEVVAWCTPDCVAGDRIDLGIFTHPDHRRKGLASVAVAATVEECLDRGFSAVGWHCSAENTSSWKTAERVGFERNREYEYYYYIYDLIDHWAELGWYYYRRGDYAKTVKYYQQVFSQRYENPDYYYHLAASAYALMGNTDKALEFLKAAAEHGWSNASWTRDQEEFRSLHTDPEWQAILTMMEANAKIN